MASRVVFLAVILYIFLRLWQVTFAETGARELGGFTLAQMLWYLAVTESIILSAPRIAQMVDRDVRTGELAVHLIKPLSYPLYCLSNSIGERVVRFALNLSVGLIIVTCFVGPIPISPLSILFLLLALPLAFV
ncbi:MAG: ABC-2 family transporter protein, partial [Candidatus Obscuribacterales bacterium]|nr:ABC-2 family transporter protein [Candidatus Obscuribacterales bacterium]